MVSTLNHARPASCTITTNRVCTLTGASYRQVDHWISQGLVAATTPSNGSGSQRGWSMDDIVRVAIINEVRQLGLPPSVGARMAEASADGSVVMYIDSEVMAFDTVQDVWPSLMTGSAGVVVHTDALAERVHTRVQEDPVVVGGAWWHDVEVQRA